ncbi:hypothetical protein [Mycobacteroides chelonae]|uniref:hypothetical protein n=1 Tax=Mycobacteroides chelonae TaxID=1774 RepID=UPI001A97228E|nr:hypothetical protein [Mycobacteroides chelonae]
MSGSTAAWDDHAVAPLSAVDTGELLTLQRAAYVTAAQAHNDLALPPLVGSLDELTAKLAELWRVYLACGNRAQSNGSATTPKKVQTGSVSNAHGTIRL